MSFAYSRDPSLLFAKSPIKRDGFAPPLNFENIFFDGKQPVRYEKEVLNMDLGDYVKNGEMTNVLDIHWIHGTLTGFYNLEEAINNIPAFTMDNFRIECSPESLSDYIMETIAFLKRGHSLMHPHCTCRHEISKRRCQTLGISYVYSEFNKRRNEIPCSLSRHPREFSAKELSDELSISDVVLFKVGNISLLPVLNNHCRIRIDGMKLFFSFNEFIFGPLDNREDLVKVLSSQCLTFTLKSDSYHGVVKDIHKMEDSGRLYLTNPDVENSFTVFYLNPKWDFPKVDSDIIALWHSVNVKDLQFTKTFKEERKIVIQPKIKKKSKKNKKSLFILKKH